MYTENSKGFKLPLVEMYEQPKYAIINTQYYSRTNCEDIPSILAEHKHSSIILPTTLLSFEMNHSEHIVILIWLKMGRKSNVWRRDSVLK